MKAENLYAELQLNPRNQTAYRKLADHYKAIGMLNEAQAFLELIGKKFNVDSADLNQESSSVNSTNP